MINVGGCLRTCLPCSICFFWLLLHAKEKGEASGSHGASSEAKVVGLTCRGGARAATLGEGAGRGCAAAAMVVGSAHAPLSSIGRSKRERERGEGWAGDADATVHDKLKRSNWDGHKMDKI
jgi:hypothetical protein